MQDRTIRTISDDSVLFVTLDSCRYDSFAAAEVPALKSVSALYAAQAPSHFTYGSHAAMFVGFTPGVAALKKRFLNPKLGRLFRLAAAGHPGLSEPGFSVDGADIPDGFRNAGYATIGSAAMGWFNPATAVSGTLRQGFGAFQFSQHAGEQVAWIEEQIDASAAADQFVFLNLGETHVPYHFEGADWAAADNPCVPFQTVDRRADCAHRQRLACEYLDRQIAPLLARFAHATILLCGDHGDAWGEDGLWEHGISCAATLTVPLLIRYRGVPVEALPD
ncbi:alkaline phosphatase family protein [Sphingomonas prati]|uniref:Membrane-anchored protein YejM (Alkaline phosphatase superfamily) n=1 Tax=Sphingomonas prati TaxID=1843237 RepID=A0A7W9BSJ1_9SPHN|nr:hypothetical protein [Sphingomonas prati]MBB5729359.1 membrane-anchored protein YejM (alkaline phosphatase superfamily) [Sphingomonas prati]